MPYNFVADSIHTKKLCSRLSVTFFKWSAFFNRKTAILRFWARLCGVRCNVCCSS